MVVRVCSGFVMADMFVGFFSRSIIDKDRKAPRISATSDTRSTTGTKLMSILHKNETAIAVRRCAEKNGIEPMIVPVKYIGKLMGDATYAS